MFLPAELCRHRKGGRSQGIGRRFRREKREIVKEDTLRRWSGGKYEGFMRAMPGVTAREKSLQTANSFRGIPKFGQIDTTGGKVQNGSPLGSRVGGKRDFGMSDSERSEHQRPRKVRKYLGNIVLGHNVTERSSSLGETHK